MVSSNGDTILVQPGTYIENIDFSGRNIVLGSLFLTTGDTIYISQTIIDGDSSGSTVRFHNQEGNSTIITGFTITNGYSTFGGGIYCVHASPRIINNLITENATYYSSEGSGAGICLVNYANAIVQNNVITNNYAVGSGGAIYISEASPTVSNNIIENNTARTGGGIGCSMSNSSIFDNIIENNLAEAAGGGLSVGSGLNISGNSIISNISNGIGGGISTYGSWSQIRENTISDNQAVTGGGISILYGHPEIEENIISGNQAQVGGGINSEDGQGASVFNNEIIDNTADSIGGAINLENSSITIAENTISGNQASSRGGAIYCLEDVGSMIVRNEISGNTSIDGSSIDLLYSSPLIYGNNITLNSAAGTGSIFCGYNSNSLISNNLLAGNIATNAGGIFCDDNTHPRIVNNTFSRNISEYGGAIYCDFISYPSLINNILWGDSASAAGPEIFYDDSAYPTIIYSNIGGGWPGEGNIDIDPLFRDPENGDFHLMAIDCGDPYDSPCIDMGDPDILDTLLNCDWGLGAERSDMGAYSGGEGYVDIDYPALELPQVTSLSQNYPNPFNSSTLIKYDLPRQSRVRIEVYDILGRKVTTLDESLQPAGYHQVIWDAEGLSSGVYFYKLRAGDYIETRKMMLVK